MKTDISFLKVRFSSASDAGKAIDFYENEQHQHVDRRPDDVLSARAKAGQILMIEDAQGTLKAASISYDFNRAATDRATGPATWIEIGSTRSTLSGIGLYPFIIASQVMERFLNDPPEETFIAAIFRDNMPVTNFLNKVVGWSLFEPKRECSDAADITKELDKIYCLEAPTTSLPHQARIVLDFIERADSGRIKNKKTGETVTFDFSDFSLAGKLKPLLQELGYGTTAHALETGAPIPMHQARQLLERHFSANIPVNKPRM